MSVTAAVLLQFSMTPPALFIPISDPVLLAVLVTLPDLISTLLTVPYESPKRPWYPDDASDAEIADAVAFAVEFAIEWIIGRAYGCPVLTA